MSANELTFTTSKIRSRSVAWYDQLISIIIPISLYFCFTNYYYISALGALTVVLLPFFAGKKNFRLQPIARRILISLMFFLLLCIISSLVVNPLQLISFDFYRRDGNIFISYLPLVVLICTAIDFNIWKIIKRFIYITTIFNIAAMGIHFISHPHPEYWMLFTAHNAAGGFLGIVCIVNFAYLCKCKYKSIPLLCLLINLFGLYLTNSRGSIFPLIGAFIFLFVLRILKLRNFDIVVNVLIFIVMFSFVYFVAGVRGTDAFVHLSSFNIPPEFAGGVVDRLLSSIGRGGTIVDRLYYLYPRAIEMFRLSPLFGTGMGTFNDINYNFEGLENIYYLNLSTTPIYSDSHAHNSFFHIMAENGLVGLSLIVILIICIRNYALKLNDRNLSNIIYLSINFIVLTSFFEHRLFTPSEILPFVYILGMIISKENFAKKEALANA